MRTDGPERDTFGCRYHLSDAVGAPPRHSWQAGVIAIADEQSLLPPLRTALRVGALGTPNDTAGLRISGHCTDTLLFYGTALYYVACIRPCMMVLYPLGPTGPVRFMLGRACVRHTQY
jgi:hypothetical protein